MKTKIIYYTVLCVLLLIYKTQISNLSDRVEICEIKGF